MEEARHKESQLKQELAKQQVLVKMVLSFSAIALSSRCKPCLAKAVYCFAQEVHEQQDAVQERLRSERQASMEARCDLIRLEMTNHKRLQVDWQPALLAEYYVEIY